MHRWKFSTLAAVACFSAALTTDVAALTLGALSVQSARGQPLRAEINISQVTAAELESLQVQIASPNVFRAHGMDYSAVARAIEVRLHRRADGSAALRLTSAAPIDTAFVDLVIDSNWSSGNLVRSYTLLLDPPASQRPAPAVTAAAQSGRSYTSQPPAQSRAPRENAPSSAQATTASNATNRRAATSGAVTVRSGDTAGQIAGTRRPNGVSLDQMLVAMLRANPDAFIGGNVNRVKSGVVLQMPDREAALSTSAAEAREIVAAQSRDFNAFRRGMASRAPQAQVAAADRTSTGRVQTQVNDASPAATPADKLTLSKGAVPSTAQTEAQLAKQKQAEAQESRKQELQRNLAELQKLADKSPAQQPAPDPAAAPAQPADSALDGTPQPSATLDVDTANPAPVTEAEAAAPGTEQATAATETASDTSAEPEKPQVDEEPPGMENLALFVGGGALALLLGLLGYLGWTRYRGADVAKKNILQPNSVAAKEDGPKDAASGADQTAAEIAPDLAVVDSATDPIAAADAYLAYGRDVQAEEVLKEALRNQPENLPVHAKLAEIFAKRHDLQQLEASARAIQTISQGEGPEWQRVRELGHNMDPGNPLYADISAAMEASVASFSSSFADALSAVSSSAPDTSVRKEPELDLHLDLDSEPPEPVDDTPAPRPSVQPRASDTAGIDLDLPSAAPETGNPRRAASTAAVDDGLNFELDGVPSNNSVDKVANSASGMSLPVDKDNGELNFDLGALNMETDATTVDDASGPLATKLDLAQEFHAIGDAEGARSLIEEVLAEATGPLKARAQKMLSSIS